MRAVLEDCGLPHSDFWSACHCNITQPIFAAAGSHWKLPGRRDLHPEGRSRDCSRLSETSRDRVWCILGTEAQGTEGRWNGGRRRQRRDSCQGGGEPTLMGRGPRLQSMRIPGTLEIPPPWPSPRAHQFFRADTCLAPRAHPGVVFL